MPTYTPPRPAARPPAAQPQPATTAGPADGARAAHHARRAGWLKTLHQWHWISSALCLAGMLLFAITGITLNHSGAIEAKPTITTHHGTLPPPLLDSLRTLAGALDGNARAVDAPLPREARTWVATAFAVDAGARDAEWTGDEIYLALPRPGGDAWLRLDLASGEAEYERTDRGWIAWANDLHKGRNTGTAWSWFIDVFAVACVVFSLTGLLILQVHASNRPAVWPVVGLGVVVPLLLILLFIH